MGAEIPTPPSSRPTDDRLPGEVASILLFISKIDASNFIQFKGEGRGSKDGRVIKVQILRTLFCKNRSHISHVNQMGERFSLAVSSVFEVSGQTRCQNVGLDELFPSASVAQFYLGP